jgi:hypothetical protein
VVWRWGKVREEGRKVREEREGGGRRKAGVQAGKARVGHDYARRAGTGPSPPISNDDRRRPHERPHALVHRGERRTKDDSPAPNNKASSRATSGSSTWEGVSVSVSSFACTYWILKKGMGEKHMYAQEREENFCT